MTLSYNSLRQHLEEDVKKRENVQYTRYLTSIDQESTGNDRDFGLVSVGSLAFSLAALALYKLATLGISDLQSEKEKALREAMLSDINEISREHDITIGEATEVVLKVSKAVSLNPPKGEIESVVKAIYGIN